MVIQVVVDRIEEDSAILVDEETGMEVRVPLSSVETDCDKGETFSIVFKEKIL